MPSDAAKASPVRPIPAKYGQVRANREKALFSHIWNYAREHGFTKLPNPCQGIRSSREGELKALLKEMAAYKTAVTPEPKVRVLSLLVNERGARLTAEMLRSRFDDAREKAGIDQRLFQFRDLRAQAATETDEASGTRSAQALLGHTTETMTTDYIRHKAGKKVRLLK